MYCEVRRSLWWPFASLRCAKTHGSAPARLPASRAVMWSAAPLPSPMRAVRAPFGPCPGEDGKSPGRTSPCGGAVYLMDDADIILLLEHARGRGRKKRRSVVADAPP